MGWQRDSLLRDFIQASKKERFSKQIRVYSEQEG